MSNKKVILGIIGAVFLLAGAYYGVYDPAKNHISYWYLGIGTWLAGIIYFTAFQKFREVTTFLIGLMILHAGVILLLIEKLSNPKLVGLLVFTGGVVIVLGSNISDYVKRNRR